MDKSEDDASVSKCPGNEIQRLRTFSQKPLEIEIVKETGSLQLLTDGSGNPNAEVEREAKNSDSIGQREIASYILLSSGKFDSKQEVESGQHSIRKASIISQTNNVHILIKTDSPREQRVTISREDASVPSVDHQKNSQNTSPCPKRYSNYKESQRRRSHSIGTNAHVRRRNHRGRHYRKRKFMDKEDYMSTVVVIATIIGAIVGVAIVVSVGAWILRHAHID